MFEAYVREQKGTVPSNFYTYFPQFNHRYSVQLLYHEELNPFIS
jgi:hypothetical protein